MRRTFQFKAKINRITEKNCFNWLNLCRELYNLALEQRIIAWKRCGKSISKYDQYCELPEFKKEFPEFKEVGSQVLRNAIERLDRSFQDFFRRIRTGNGKPGFPRFKGGNRYNSFALSQAGWKLEGKNLHIRNLGRFKLFLSRPIQGDIKTITIKKDSVGDWFASFSCDNVPAREFPPTEREVGIDVGISSFLTDSEGRKVENPKFFRKSEKLLRRRQRSLSRKKKGSRRRGKAKVLVAKAHRKVTNQRKDFLHKTANYYIENFKTIYVEDLKIGNMVKNRHLAKSISDASWGLFTSMLSYKAEEAGREVVKVNPRNTSQNCSACGNLVKKSLAVRIHNCPFCGLILDRDENASLNILAVGQTAQTLTSALAGVA